MILGHGVESRMSFVALSFCGRRSEHLMLVLRRGLEGLGSIVGGESASLLGLEVERDRFY